VEFLVVPARAVEPGLGIVASNTRVHAILPWLFLTLLAFIASVFFLQPEAMLPSPARAPLIID
jgi:hypothetical protein